MATLTQAGWSLHTCLVFLFVIFLILDVMGQATPTVNTGSPYIMTQPGNQTVLEGQRVNFPCGTEGYPNTINHNWFKDQVDVRKSDGFRAGRISILTDGSLVIKTAVKTDKGWYLCRASNGLGHDEATAYLNVVYKPVVLPLPSQLIWAKGYRQQIDCPVDSNPPLLHIIWVKDQEQLQNRGRFDILDNGTLLVTDVMDVDSGSYRCTPENAMGQGLSSNRVQVMVKDPPQITVSPQLLYIKHVGDSVTMNCEATGTPAVSLQWIKVGGKLDGSSSRIKITDKYLEIYNLTKDDHGKYECKAINTIATVVSVTELRIDNTTPHAPYNVTVVPGVFNVSISWQPAYDGGYSQAYLLWFRQVSQLEWRTMPVPEQEATFFNLYSLQPDTEYEFKLLSRNSNGNGSFSEVVRQRTLGYSPEAVNVLPTGENGIPYYPDISTNIGPEPAAPKDVTAHVRSRDILVNWRNPTFSPVPIFSYKIEYQHDGQWQVYDQRIIGNTTNNAIMDDMPLGTYDICLRSYGVLAKSSLSNIARVHISGDDVVIPQAMVGGIVGGVLFLLVAILLALVAVFYSRRKERKAKEKKYDDVNYGKPDEMNGRHHESTSKRDRWQHNGRGDLMTTLSNTDSIFFLPQTHCSRDQSASGMMRPLILLDRSSDRDSLPGRGVVDGIWTDAAHDSSSRQVPLTNELSFASDRSHQPGTFVTKPDQTKLDVRNLTWPYEQHDGRSEHQILSTSLQIGHNQAPVNYSPYYDYSPPQTQFQHSPIPRSYPTLYKSHSVPTQNLTNMGPYNSLYPNHSIHVPISHPSSHYNQPVNYISHPSSPQNKTLDQANITKFRQNQQRLSSVEYPSFHSQDDDVFRSLPLSSGHYPTPGFPRHSSLKPSQMTYLTDDGVDPHSDTIIGIKDISSVLDTSHLQQPNISQTTLPFGLDFNRPSFADSTNIPYFYVNTDSNINPNTLINSDQFQSSNVLDNSLGNYWPQASSSAQWPGDIQQLHATFGTPSLRSRSKLSNQSNTFRYSDSFPQSRASLHNHPSQFSQSHSNLRFFRDNEEDSTAETPQPEVLDEHEYYNEPARPRAFSEGSSIKKQAPYFSSDIYQNGQDLASRRRPPYSFNSYPDMLKHERTAPNMRDKYFPYRQSDSNSVDPSVQQYKEQIQKTKPLFHHHHPQPQQQSSTWLNSTERKASPFHQRNVDLSPHITQTHAPTDVQAAMLTTSRYGYSGNSCEDHVRYDDTLPVEVGSHSSGIGSRNTSQSTGSYHPHRRGSTGKGSASFSSSHGHDLSLEISGGQGLGHPVHRRDTSGDENYEFDSLHAIENDIINDIRRYSQLSGDLGTSTTYNRSFDKQDSSVPQPSKPSQYPDSERRFEKLREEFKQYRQHQYDPSDGIFQMPPTVSAALPIGMNGEPLYPMDSEML